MTLSESNLNIIVAATEDGGIGIHGNLPWKIPQDMAFFKQVTLNSVVIMGRRTWESIPSRFRPLSDRVNIVLSRSPDFVASEQASPHRAFTSLDEALASLVNETVFVIGGSALYQEALHHPNLTRIYLTRVTQPLVETDVSFPKFDQNVFKRVLDPTTILPFFPMGLQHHGKYTFEFQVYDRT